MDSSINHPSFRVLSFCKKNVVFLIALFAAIVTSFIIPPNKEYLSYLDFSTLCCLFSTLAVVNALKEHKFFTILAEKIVSLTGNLRVCIVSLVYITFIGSMLIANDMALLTFLPLGCYILISTGNEKYMAFTFILQNCAANLGGMLTPFGNPQNLYLYSYFQIPTLKFTRTMLYPFLLAMVLITIACLVLFPKDPIVVKTKTVQPLPKGKTIFYLLLFLCVILSVFRLIPYYVIAAIVLVAMLLFERNALIKVDYPLLLTFVCFFIFAGNMVRIPSVQTFFERVLSIGPLLVSTLSCQFISNVPTAILLSGFTSDYKALLLGVNIGGVGSLVSSLASLITFRTFCTYQKDQVKKYLLLFSVISFSFLIILFLFCQALISFNLI